MRPQAIITILALLGGGFLATRGGGDGNGAAPTPTVSVKGEVLREPITVPGPDPFTQPISFSSGASGAVTSSSTTTSTPTTSAPGGSTTTQGPISIASTSGATPGLYGGTLNNAECNKAQLVTFLQQNADKAKAWADVQQIPVTELAAYVARLTPATLEADTRVTNHGFVNGVATPRQTVLQKGSAVLVDNFGTPRVRCYCGNPLIPPVAQAERASFTGPSWPAFDATNLQAVTPSPTPLSVLQLKDVTKDAGIARPIGSDGTLDKVAAAPPKLAEPRDRDLPAATTTTPPTTTRGSTTTLATPTTRGAFIPIPTHFVQKDGTVGASSVYSAAYATNFAVDGDRTTSWFSAGSVKDGPTTTFRWTGKQDDLITLVRIVGNGAHAEPANRTNFGFGAVTIRVRDASGDIDFEQTVQLPGTPDPDAIVQPGVRGRVVELVFSGGEAPDCGGFSELEVGVTR